MDARPSEFCIPAGHQRLVSDGGRQWDSRIDVSNDGRSPDVDARTVLDPGWSRELPVGVESPEGGDDETSTSSSKGSDQDHGPGRVSNRFIWVREDGVDSKGRDTDRTTEPVDDTESKVAGELWDGENEREDRSFGDDEGDESRGDPTRQLVMQDDEHATDP